MNLFDFIDQDATLIDAERPMVEQLVGDALRDEDARAAGLVVGARVRAADGRLGRVFLFVPATDRVFVRFDELERSVPVSRVELEVIGAPCDHASWVAGETDWPGYGLRLTATCRDCGEVRGRT